MNIVTERDPLLTTKEAAELLGTTEGTLEVWRCTQRYKLPYVKIGRNVRYRRSAIDAFIASRTVEPNADERKHMRRKRRVAAA